MLALVQLDIMLMRVLTYVSSAIALVAHAQGDYKIIVFNAKLVYYFQVANVHKAVQLVHMV